MGYFHGSGKLEVNFKSDEVKMAINSGDYPRAILEQLQVEDKTTLTHLVYEGQWDDNMMSGSGTLKIKALNHIR